MLLFTTASDVGGGTYNGTIKTAIGGTVVTEVQPTGITGMNRRPVGIHYKKRFYLVGQFSRPMVRTEFRKWHPMGIHAPVQPPVLALGADSGGSIGLVRGKFTFAHKVGDRIVHESAGSDASNELSVSGEGRVWSGLPTTSPDERVNVIRGYLSFDGDPYRFTWERPLGVTTVTENVRFLARGELLNDRRGVPPYTELAMVYHGRFLFFRDPKLSFRVWIGENGEPESLYVLSYRDMPGGIQITGGALAGANNDTAVIFGRNTTIDIQGYSAADFNVRTVDSVYGNIAPFGPANVHGFVLFPSIRGICMYAGGAVHFLGGEIEDFWLNEYKENTAAYEDGYGFDDKQEQCYKFMVQLPAVAAPGAPTVALAGSGAGNLSAGAYTYRVTFMVDHGGELRETQGGTASGTVTVVTPASNGKVNVTAIPLGGTRTRYRKLYRTTAGGAQHKFLALIADNTTTSYLDNIADSALGANAPTVALPRTLYYLVHYEEIDPSRAARGIRPRITFNVRGRLDSVMGRVADSNTHLEQTYVGSCDGYVRRENVADDADDDGDTYQKRMVVEHGHDYFEDVGGSRMQGKVFTDETVFIVNENQAATLKLFVGNDQAAEGEPRFTKTIPSGASAGKVGRDEFYTKPFSGGHGITARLEIVAPVGVQYRGHAGAWRDGLKTRPSLS